VYRCVSLCFASPRFIAPVGEDDFDPKASLCWTAGTHPVTAGEAHAGLGWPGQAATAHSPRNAAPQRRRRRGRGGRNLGRHRENDTCLVPRGSGRRSHTQGGIDLGVRYIVETLAGILPAGRRGRDRRRALGRIQDAPSIAYATVCSTGRGLAAGDSLQSIRTRMSPIPALRPDSGLWTGLRRRRAARPSNDRAPRLANGS
jgi:hypothetical protein